MGTEWNRDTLAASVELLDEPRRLDHGVEVLAAGELVVLSAEWQQRFHEAIDRYLLRRVAGGCSARIGVHALGLRRSRHPSGVAIRLCAVTRLTSAQPPYASGGGVGVGPGRGRSAQSSI